MSRLKVTLITLFLFGLIIGFDAYLYLDGVEGNSITQIIIAVSESYPIVPASVGFVFGFLLAHFFDTKSQT